MTTAASAQHAAELLESSEQYKKLKRLHAEYERRLNELGERRFPSSEEQLEEARLKKLKLNLKDQMANMVVERADRAQ